MRPISFKNCNFCSIYLLNNKDLECGRISTKRCYTQGLSIFLFNISLKKYWFEAFSCVWSNLCFAGCFFPLNGFIKKSIDLKRFHAFGRSFLVAGFFSGLKLFQAVGLPFCWLALSWSFLILRPIWAENQKLRIRFKNCSFCSIYLLNNKNLECVLYARFVHIPFQYFFEKVLIWSFFMRLVESLFCWLLFSIERLNQKSIDLKRFHAFGRIVLFAGYLKALVSNFFKLLVFLFCWLPCPWSF